MENIMTFVNTHPYYTFSIVCGVVWFIWVLIRIGFIGGFIEILADIFSALT